MDDAPMTDPRLLCGCGSGKRKWPNFDARDIFLCYSCDACHADKMARFRPEVLTDPNYDTGTDVVESDDGEV